MKVYKADLAGQTLYTKADSPDEANAKFVKALNIEAIEDPGAEPYLGDLPEYSVLSIDPLAPLSSWQKAGRLIFVKD